MQVLKYFYVVMFICLASTKIDLDNFKIHIFNKGLWSLASFEDLIWLATSFSWDCFCSCYCKLYYTWPLSNIYLGELEEIAAELEIYRRKLATLCSKKKTAAIALPTVGAAHLNVKTKGGDRVSGSEKVSREARELEAALKETKVHLELPLDFSSHFKI